MSKITQTELDGLIVQTNNKAKKIKCIDKLIAAMPEGRGKKQYTEEMLGLIEEYHVEVNILEVSVSDYLEQVKEDTGEIPLIYFKLLKGLKDS